MILKVLNNYAMFKYNGFITSWSNGLFQNLPLSQKGAELMDYEGAQILLAVNEYKFGETLAFLDYTKKDLTPVDVSWLQNMKHSFQFKSYFSEFYVNFYNSIDEEDRKKAQYCYNKFFLNKLNKRMQNDEQSLNDMLILPEFGLNYFDINIETLARCYNDLILNERKSLSFHFLKVLFNNIRDDLTERMIKELDQYQTSRMINNFDNLKKNFKFRLFNYDEEGIYLSFKVKGSYTNRKENWETYEPTFKFKLGACNVGYSIDHLVQILENLVIYDNNTHVFQFDLNYSDFTFLTFFLKNFSCYFKRLHIPQFLVDQLKMAYVIRTLNLLPVDASYITFVRYNSIVLNYGIFFNHRELPIRFDNTLMCRLFANSTSYQMWKLLRRKFYNKYKSHFKYGDDLLDDRFKKFSKISKIEEYVNKRIGNYLLLLKSGDVEENPGPVFSKFCDSESVYRANNYIDYRPELQSFTFFSDFSEISNSLKNYATNGLTLNLNFDQIKQQFSSVYPQIFLCLMSLYRSRDDKVTCVLIITQLLVSFGFSLSQVHSVFNYIYPKFLNFMKWIASYLGISPNAQDNVVLQSSGDNDDIPKNFIMTFFSKLFNFNMSPKDILINCNKINTVDKGVRGIESLLSKLIAYSKQVIDFLFIKMYGQPTDDFTKALLEWNERCLKVLSLENRPNMSNEEMTIELDSLMDQGNKYIKLLDGSRDKGLIEMFKVQFAQLRHFHLKFSKTAIPQHMKKPPYVVFLTGDSGIGKSQVMPYILLNLLREDPFFIAHPEKIENFAKYIHYRQTENEFWDSLQNEHRYLFLDDFAQASDKMQSSEFAELIRICNSAPAKAHMSGVLEKGTIELDFKAIVLSSNQKHPKSENITHPDAIMRRLEGYTWIVDLKEEYKRYEGVPGKQRARLDATKAGDTFNPDVYLFKRYNIHTGHVGTTLDFEEFCQTIRFEYKRHMDRSDKLFDHLENYAKEMRQKIEMENNEVSSSEINNMEMQLQSWNPRDWFKKTNDGPTTRSILLDTWLMDNFNAISIVLPSLEVSNDDRKKITTYMELPEDASVDFIEQNYFLFYLLFTRIRPITNKIEEVKKKLIELNLQNTVEWETYLQLKFTENLLFKNIVNGLSKILVLLTDFVLSALLMSGVFKIVNYLWNFIKSIYSWLFPMQKKRMEKHPRTIFYWIKINGQLYFKVIGAFCENEEEGYVDTWHSASVYFAEVNENYCFVKSKYMEKDHWMHKYLASVFEYFYKIDPNYTNDLVKEMTTEQSIPDFKVEEKKLLEIGKKQDETPQQILEKYSKDIVMQRQTYLEKYSKNIDPIARPYLETNNRLEIAIDPCVKNISMKAFRNQVAIVIESNGSLRHLGYGTFFKGKLLATFSHVLATIYDKEFYIRPVFWTSEQATYKVLPSQVMVRIPEIKHLGLESIIFKLNDLQNNLLIYNENYKGKDFCVLDLSEHLTVPLYPDISKHFISTNDLSKVNGSPSFLSNYINGNTITQRCGSTRALDFEREGCSGIVNDGDIKGIVNIRDGYSYNAQTESGDCGTLLFVENNYIEGKILGFHVMADIKGCGAAVSVTREMLKSVETKTLQIGYDLDLTMKDNLESAKQGVLYMGSLSEPIKQNCSSSIRRSPVYNRVFVSPNKPAYLYSVNINGEMKDPYKIGIQKYFTMSPWIAESVLLQTANDFDYFMDREMTDVRDVRLYTLEEALFGVEGEEYFRSVMIKTSPGYSWDRMNMPGKRYYVDNDLKTYLPIVKERVDRRTNLAKENIREPHYYTATLKDETRPIEKVDKGKTRVFSVPQFDLVLATRIYFGAFATNFMNNKIRNRSLIGINMYSVESHLFAKNISKYKHILTGDFANWDGSIRADISWKLLHYINKFYTKYDRTKNIKEDNKIREILFYDLINCFIIFDKEDVYMLTHSLPSGHPLTAIINTMYNIFRSFLEYNLITSASYIDDKLTDDWENFRLCMKPWLNSDITHLANIKSYLENTEGGFYGDDLLLSVSHKLINFYNYKTIKIVNKLMGHTYTTSEKLDEIDREYDSFEKANILKRYFVYDSKICRYIAPLEITTIYDIPNWIKKGESILEQTLLNVETAARELSLHSRDIYEKFVNDYDRELSCFNLKPYFELYDVCRKKTLNGDYMLYAL